MLVIVGLLAISAAEGQAAVPDWARNNTQNLIGDRYRVVCSGRGPSIDFARREAIDNCRLSAAQLLAPELSVKLSSYASERYVAYHQEVSKQLRIAGLTCIPQREQIEQTHSVTRLWLQCEFDLSKAKRLSSRAHMEAGDVPPVGRYLFDNRRILTLATVPPCSDLIVRGNRAPARVVLCKNNPISVVLESDDEEVIVRANGYLPKTIDARATERSRRYISVLLDPSI